MIEYRETLEEQGMKNSEEIEKKVEIKRKRLEVDYGLSGSNEGSKNRKLYFTPDSYSSFVLRILIVQCSFDATMGETCAPFCKFFSSFSFLMQISTLFNCREINCRAEGEAY